MTDEDADRRARQLFEAHRSHLRGVAYRMLGSLSDVDDVLQDAFVRMTGVDAEEVRHPSAYLTRVVTRLCIDHLESARVRREQYVGPWLPEPVVEEGGGSTAPDEVAAFREDVSLALMYALERLSPLERAAFILHDVFDVDYADVATALGREPAACRQLAARGRKHVRDNRPRFAASSADSQALLGVFVSAAMSGDLEGLRRLLARDATFASDGGGKVPAATKVVRGAEAVAKLIAGLVRKHYADADVAITPATVNGEPGFLVREAGVVTQAVAFDIREGEVFGIYSVRNPDKLGHLNRTH